MKRLYTYLLMALTAVSCVQDPDAPSNLPDAPALSVDETSVTRVSMLVNGTFGKNMADITAYGVEISETLFEAGKTYKTLAPQLSGSGFSLGVTDLKSNNTYFLRSFISNGHSKMYSSTITQQTPETSVASISDVTVRDNFLVAIIEDNGGRSIEDVGFMWGTSSERKDLKREKRYPGTMSADGKTFTLPLAEVGQGTHYILAYAEDDKDGTGYSRFPYEIYIDPGTHEVQPNNEIWYTSYDNKVIHLNNDYFNTKLVSNTYEDGKGILRFEEDLTLIGDWDFWGSGITSIHLPNTLEIIGDLAFYMCEHLESVHIPESVRQVGNECFGGCSRLSSFSGKNATSDHRSLVVDGTLVAFAPYDLTEYTVDASVKAIGKYVFRYCSTLRTIRMSEGLEVIEEGAFESCTSLSEVHLSSTLVSIRTQAFRFCSELSIIEIPQSVTTIDRNVFDGCTSLHSFSGKFASEDGRCLVYNIYEGYANDPEYEILGFALAGQEEYTIPDGIVNTSALSFQSLKRLVFPETVATLGQIYQCPNLESITVKAVTPPSFIYAWGSADGSPCELHDTNNCPVYVPAESVEAYRTAEKWSAYGDRIQVIGPDSGGN